MSEPVGLGDLVPVTTIDNVPLWRQIILLYGEPKIGKTTEAAKFKDAIFFDAENGTLGINVPTFENLLENRDRLDSPIKIWEDVLAATSVLERAANKGYRGTVVVDTAPASYDMCREYTLRQNGWQHETDGAYGKGWRAVKDAYSMWVNRLKGMGFGIVFTAHVKSTEIEEPTRKYEKLMPRLDTGPRDIIEPFANLIMYAHTMHVRGRDLRVVRTKPLHNMVAGERGMNPRLPELLPFDMHVIERAWNGEVIDLNAHFGFSEPASPPATPLVEANQEGEGGAPAESEATDSNGVQNLRRNFGATEKDKKFDFSK